MEIEAEFRSLFENLLDFLAEKENCKFCDAQGKKVYLRLVEILLVFIACKEKSENVYSVAFKKPPRRVYLMPLNF